MPDAELVKSIGAMRQLTEDSPSGEKGETATVEG